MRAIITGATGTVGMALIDELVRNEFEVLVLCRTGSRRSSNIKENSYVTKVDCSLDEMKNFVGDGKKYDYFFHLAWDGTTGATRNDMHLQNKNIDYTLDAVELAARLGCSCFIGAGSQAEYGRVEGKINGRTPAFPENGYGIAKFAAGRMSRIMCENLGMRHVWARILSVYGPYDGARSMVMSTIIELKKGNTPKFTPGEQIWDYMYSEDAARALLAIAQRGKDGSVYCLGDGKGAMLKEYIEKIRDAVSPNAALGLGEIPYAKNQVMYLCADISDLQKDTGFVPVVSFDEGIAKTVSWFDEFVKIYD